MKKQSGGIANLIEGINSLSNSMTDNHSKMEAGGNKPNGYGISNVVGNVIGSGNVQQVNGGSFYRWKPESNYT